MISNSILVWIRQAPGKAWSLYVVTNILLDEAKYYNKCLVYNTRYHKQPAKSETNPNRTDMDEHARASERGATSVLTRD